jgi:membrane protein
MVFSLPPMLFVIFWMSGFWYEEILVREAVFDEFGGMIGKQGSDQLMNTLDKLSANRPTVLATIIGVGMLLFTASTVLVTMKKALNDIFEVTDKRTVKQGIVWMLLDRFLSIAMLCILAIILTLSMILKTLITALNQRIDKWLENSNTWVVLFDQVLISLLTLTLLFAITYRYMPDTRLKWKDTWFGAILTALLFVVGESLIELSIGSSQIANYYDAAGGILILMLWVYYTSAIFLFGATVTHVRANLITEIKVANLNHNKDQIL